MTNRHTYDAAHVWCDTFPRRVTRKQHWAYSPDEVVELVDEIEGQPNNSPYISLYSFPDGHTKENKVPRIDTLFVDFDIPEFHENERKWRAEMRELLKRLRMVAQAIIEYGNPEHWRGSLSGSKGAHLYHDFPAVHPDNGSFEQFHNGLNKYGNKTAQQFANITGQDDIAKYIDATVTGDLGRLTRLPNTIHEKATAAFGEERYCVPVTLEEMASVTVDRYIDLTRSTRPVPDECQRNPNQKAHDALVQYIRNAPEQRASSSRQTSVYDPARVAAYKEKANDAIEVEDLPFVMEQRPCVVDFIERGDRFSHGGESHMMEMKAITEMMAEGVPIDTIVDAFDEADVDDSFDRKLTYDTVEKYISYGFNPVNCEKIWNQAARFCLGDECGVYQREAPDQENRNT